MFAKQVAGHFFFFNSIKLIGTKILEKVLRKLFMDKIIGFSTTILLNYELNKKIIKCILEINYKFIKMSTFSYYKFTHFI